jgi:hypothetical protein
MAPERGNAGVRLVHGRNGAAVRKPLHEVGERFVGEITQGRLVAEEPAEVVELDSILPRVLFRAAAEPLAFVARLE